MLATDQLMTDGAKVPEGTLRCAQRWSQPAVPAKTFASSSGVQGAAAAALGRPQAVVQLRRSYLRRLEPEAMHEDCTYGGA